jgi:hypothetical protein
MRKLLCKKIIKSIECSIYAKKFHILKESHWIDEHESYRLLLQFLRLEIVKSLRSDDDC